MHALGNLNANQLAAAEASDGPVLIVAGPGTGKTKTLTSRIAWLIESGKAGSADIVALTFTNKAAREMRERVELLLENKTKLPKITTFHALGADILKHHAVASKLLDEEHRTEIIRELPKSAALKGLSLRELSLQISRYKTSLNYSSFRPEPALDSDRGSRNLVKKGVASSYSSSNWVLKQVQSLPPTRLGDDATSFAVAKFLESYENALASQELYDFDDLLVKSYKLLNEHKTRRPNYKYVLVDEFQDTSELQYEMLKLLTDSKSYFAIGDPNQSIYSFRGAGTEMFARFREDFPRAKAIDLTVNYRSKPEIINLANNIFPESPQLVPFNSGQGIVKSVRTLNEYSEAAYILNAIEQGIGGSDMLKAGGHIDVHEPRDFVVLYRTHRVAAAVQRAFGEAGIPYQVAGEGSPYEQPEIQQVIAALRVVRSPTSDNKAKLVKYHFCGNSKEAQINTLLVKYKNYEDVPVCDLAKDIVQFLGLEYSIRIEQFLGSLVQYGTCRNGLQLFLDDFETLIESEFYDPNVNAVTFLTIHAAKGLEFNHVFLIGAEEGILPKITKAGETNIDEERRMFYVAVTRAKESLEILHAKNRSSKPVELSRFVTEIPVSILPRTTDPILELLERRAKKRQQKRAQSSLF